MASYEQARQQTPMAVAKTRPEGVNGSQNSTPGESLTSVSMLVHAGSAHSAMTRTDPDESSDGGATQETGIKQARPNFSDK
jgi:hypothetical protein